MVTSLDGSPSLRLSFPKALLAAWAAGGGYDGLLGFSNGAAASFLLASHMVQDKVRGWRERELLWHWI
jgi:hypothetical protein